MVGDLKLILDTSKADSKEVHTSLIKTEKKLRDEYIGSAVFSMVIDATTKKSNIYEIPIKKMSRPKRIYIRFKRKGK